MRRTPAPEEIARRGFARAEAFHPREKGGACPCPRRSRRWSGREPRLRATRCPAVPTGKGPGRRGIRARPGACGLRNPLPSPDAKDGVRRAGRPERIRETLRARRILRARRRRVPGVRGPLLRPRAAPRELRCDASEWRARDLADRGPPTRRLPPPPRGPTRLSPADRGHRLAHRSRKRRLAPVGRATAGQDLEAAPRAPSKVERGATRKRPARPSRRRKSPHSFGLRRIDRGVLGQTHDPEGLVDRRRQATEGEPAVPVHDFLEHLDQDGNTDRVDDAGLFQVQDESASARLQLRVRLSRDLLSPLVVDVSVGRENRHVSAPLGRNPANFAHLYFLMRIRVPPSPDEMATESIRLRMICNPHPRFWRPEKVFSAVGISTDVWSKPLPRSRTSTSRNSRAFSRPTRNVRWTRSSQACACSNALIQASTRASLTSSILSRGISMNSPTAAAWAVATISMSGATGMVMEISRAPVASRLIWADSRRAISRFRRLRFRGC